MNLDFPSIETKILKFWQENKIFEKLRKKNQNKKHWSFLDGPITANNPMGVHHAWGRTYKDVFQRYKAMQGFDQRFQNGFDCQGLWVEVEVEKEMGFKTKKDIEKFGIEKFVEACKQRVIKYSKIQTAQSIRLGQWMDWENSYYTMSDENNYAIWDFLKKCRQKGLLYKGRDVVPWCIRCGTAISQHEILTEEYQEITHKSIFVKLPIVGRKNTFFLVWTTTPWTLPANVALAVSPKLKYSEIQDKNGDIFIVLKDKANLVLDGKIIKEYLGKKLEGLEYKGIFDELEEVRKEMGNKTHKVILWEDISEEEGTGIVHIASGCGQEDFQLSKEFKLTVIDPTDEESRYKEGFGFLTSKLVTEANDLIFENLKNKNLVFKIEDYKHRYPTCWRCKEELIFRLVDEWYISIDKLRKPLMGVAEKIKWIPSFGLGRELDWLKNMQDWLISKKRYWGLALPIYECRCGNFEIIGSKEELKERAVEGWDKFDGHSPHRPWVDEVKIKCSKCGNLVSRIPDVGNPWLDAGIVPFSTMRYYKDKDYWKRWFPVDFICESFPGQFKNWFYALIVMSTVLENTNPVKTIFGYASVRDEEGEEMHKSKGNAIWFDEAVEKIGADPMRWMYSRQNPIYNLKFGYKAAEEIKRKLLTLYNSFVFFNTYVDRTEFSIFLDAKRTPRRVAFQFSNSKNILDKWIVSRLNSLIEKVSRNFDKYNASAVVLAIENFFIEDLSLWYIRRSRNRFHSDNKARKEAVCTLYYVLLNLTKIISPIMPFFAEEMYARIKLDDMPESVHLYEWPESEKEKIDKDLEEKMKKIREIVTLSLAERAAKSIKVRQPIASLKIKNSRFHRGSSMPMESASGQISKIKNKEELLELIKDEVNVKKIVFDNKIKKEVELDTKITKDLKEEGIVREIIRHIQDLRKKEGLTPADFIETCIDISLSSKYIDYIKEKTLSKVVSSKKANKMNGYIIKEIKLDEEKHYIGIKK